MDSADSVNLDLRLKDVNGQHNFGQLVGNVLSSSGVLPVLSDAYIPQPPASMASYTMLHTQPRQTAHQISQSELLPLPLPASSSTPPLAAVTQAEPTHANLEQSTHTSPLTSSGVLPVLPLEPQIQPTFSEELADKSSKSKKRSRARVDYAALDNSDDDYEDGRSIKKSKPKTDIVIEDVTLSVSNPLPVSGAARRLTQRMETLNTWFDSIQGQDDETIVLPNLSVLTVLCTDLHTVDKIDEFGTAEEISKMVSSLRFITLLSRSRKSKFSDISDGSNALRRASEIQCGMIATVTILFLLNNESFDRKYVNDDCLDESMNFLSFVATGFLHALIDNNEGFLHMVGAATSNSAENVTDLLSRGKTTSKAPIKKPRKNTPSKPRSKSTKAYAHSEKTSSTNFVSSVATHTYSNGETIEAKFASTPLGPLVSHIVVLLSESLDHLASLTSKLPNLADIHVVRLQAISRLSLFAPCLASIQVPALKLLRISWLLFPKYRQSIIQDIFDSVVDLEKGHHAPENIRLGPLHVVTGTLLRLLQANSEVLCDTTSSELSTENSTLDEKKAKDSRTRNTLLSRHFIKLMFDMVLEHSDIKDDAYHTVVDCMVHDLTSIVFKPEYPTSELVLRDILTILLSHLQSAYSSTNTEQKVTSSKLNERLRTSFGTWLSLIGTKLVSVKLYTITANMITRQPKGDAESRLLFESGKCPLCTHSYTGKAMTCCSRCMRWFHLDCYGINPLAVDSKAEWHCDSCLVGFVSELLEPHFNTSSNSLDDHKATSKASASVLESSSELSHPLTGTVDPFAPTDLISGTTDETAEVDEDSPEYRAKLPLIHSAMRALLFNYMNNHEGYEIQDAKRFLIRQWMLESDVTEGSAIDSILKSQYSSSCPPFVTYPLDGPVKLNKTQLEENTYVKLLTSFAEDRHKFESSDAKKIGLLPSRLGVQVFLTRFSMSSSYGNPSIFAYFPKLIESFVAMLNSDLAKMRALSLRAITNMAEADMSILQDPALYAAVEARLIDPSPMTREKALNMVGRFILMNPRVLPQYVLLVRDRLEDASVSVRKRAVRIVRSICLTIPNSPHCVILCVALAKRVTKQSEGIKDLAMTFFREYWFADETQKTEILKNAKKELFDVDLPAADLSTSMTATEDESDLDESGYSIFDRLSAQEKVDQILQVLQETLHLEADRDVVWFVELIALVAAYDTHQSQFLTVFLKLLVNFLSGVGEEADREYERTRKCELLVDEHANNPQMRRAANAALAQNKEDVLKKKWIYSVALTNLAHVVPHLVGEHFHQLCVLVAVFAPTPGTNPLEKKISEKILAVLSAIIPKIRYPSDETWSALLKDLSQLLRSHGMPVIAASIKCAAAIARRTNPNWIRSLYTALATQLRNYVRGSIAAMKGSSTPTSKSPSNPHDLSSQSIIRFLYTLGMILKSYPLDPPSQLRERDLKTVEAIRAFRYGPCVEEVYNFIVHFWKSEDRDVKTSAVLTLGHLAPSSPGIFVRAVSEEILSSALAPSAAEQLKAQAIKTIHEFLTEDAERMKSDPKSIASLTSVDALASKSHAIRTLTPSRGARSLPGDGILSPKKAGNGKSRQTLRGRKLASYESEEDDLFSDDNDYKSATYENDTDLDSLMGGVEHLDEMSSTSSSTSSSTTVRHGKSGSSETKSVLKDVAVDTGLSSTIVEIYIKRVLGLGLDKSIAIRSASLNLVEQVLKMGLTHPAHCVPMLVALETDDILGEVAHRSLASLDMPRILNRIAVGIQTSFNFQRAVYRTPKAIRVSSDSSAVTFHSNMGRLYLIFADSGKVSRNNFLAAAFGLFEKHADAPNFDSLFVTYLTLLLAQLPFTSQEEALFAVYQANRCIDGLGNSALTRLKKWYSTSEKPTQSSSQDSNLDESTSDGSRAGVRSNIQKSKIPTPPVKDLQDAIVAWHLLMLKKFMRAFYALTGERCRNFMPSDSTNTPIAHLVSTVNVQDYLQHLDPTFDEFRVENEFWKKPDTCRRIYTLLKRAIKSQEDDHAYNDKNRLKRKATSNGFVKSEVKTEHPSEAQRSTPSRTSSKSSIATPRSAKTKNKSNGYYNAAKDEDFQV